MKIDIYIPQELSDITLGQYQKFTKINTGENENTSFLLHKMVEIFCNIDLKDIAKIKYTYVNNIVSEINKMFDVKTSLIPTFKMGGVDYGFIPKLDDISLGEYIDLDNTLGDWETMHKAMSVLYRTVKLQKGNRYQIEDYTGMENAEVMKGMPLDVVMGSLVFFLDFKKRTVEKYPEIFIEGDDRESDYTTTSNFGRKWGWYQSIYGLAKGDITQFEHVTKLNVHQSFMYLAFEKEKIELEKSMIKKR